MGSLRNGAERGVHEENEKDEPILMVQSQRFCMFPIRYPQLWEMYKKAQASFWTAEEVDLSLDVQQWETLSDSEKHFISHVLAFFAASDGIVLENLAARFLNDVQIPEHLEPGKSKHAEEMVYCWARAFYGFQIAMENVHSEMYSLLLETYIKDSSEKSKLFNAIETIPCVAEKAKWSLNWIESFVRKKLPWEKVHEIVNEAVEIETNFVCDALPCALIGMNSELMSHYIKFVADHLLVALGYQKKYNVENPFDWMEFISLQGKANFFERRVGDYQKASVMSNLRDSSKNFEFKLNEDF
nr:ribonucleoside-diphosphate reductase small chain A [Ipomoea batatas]